MMRPACKERRARPLAAVRAKRRGELQSVQETPMADQNQNQNQMRVKITDETLRGVYANQMVVSHTKEEFILDFVNLFPPEGIVNARIIISPGHLKRVIRALAENVRKYEERFGEIREAAEPGKGDLN
jgi:signal transduction histidine kinase